MTRADVRRLGLEGLITFKSEHRHDPERYELALPTPTGGEVRIGVFDRVHVLITVEKVRGRGNAGWRRC